MTHKPKIEPEAPGTINTTELGNPGLSERDQIAIVECMQTLKDGFQMNADQNLMHSRGL